MGGVDRNPGPPFLSAISESACGRVIYGFGVMRLVVGNLAGSLDQRSHALSESGFFVLLLQCLRQALIGIRNSKHERFRLGIGHVPREGVQFLYILQILFNFPSVVGQQPPSWPPARFKASTVFLASANKRDSHVFNDELERRFQVGRRETTVSRKKLTL